MLAGTSVVRNSSDTILIASPQEAPQVKSEASAAQAETLGVTSAVPVKLERTDVVTRSGTGSEAPAMLGTPRAASVMLTGTKVPVSIGEATEMKSLVTTKAVPIKTRDSKPHRSVKKRGSKSHLCPDCGAVFSHKTSLVSHRREKHSFGTGCRYTCDTCSKGFMHYREFESHVNMHSDTKPHTCEDCKKTFSHERSLRRHRCTSFKKSHACGVCGKVFRDKRALVEHEPAHDDLPRYLCEFCARSYRYASALRQHRLECAGCKQKSAHEVTSDKQTNSYIEKPTKKYACTNCSKTFINKLALRRHGPVHDKIPRYSCDSCIKRFKFRSGLTKHKSGCEGCKEKIEHTCVEHKQARVYVCSICAEPFNTKKSFHRHFYTHRGVTSGVSFSSPDRSFLPDDSLQESSKSGTSDTGTVSFYLGSVDRGILSPELRNPVVSSDQTGLEPSASSGFAGGLPTKLSQPDTNLSRADSAARGVAEPASSAAPNQRPESSSRTATKSTQMSGGKRPCPDCGRLFGHRSSLLIHRREKHGYGGGLRFACEICGKGTMKPEDFESHMNMHAKRKPHECEGCKKKFASKRSLQQHKCAVHRTHACSICGRGFSRRCFLFQHERSHNRVYECSLCQKQFKFRSGLNNHKRRCTGGNELCPVDPTDPFAQLSGDCRAAEWMNYEDYERDIDTMVPISYACEGYSSTLHSEIEVQNHSFSQDHTFEDDLQYFSPNVFVPFDPEAQCNSLNDSPSFVGNCLNGSQSFVDNQNGRQSLVDYQNGSPSFVDYQNDSQSFVDYQTDNQSFVDYQNDSQSFVDYLLDGNSVQTLPDLPSETVYQDVVSENDACTDAILSPDSLLQLTDALTTQATDASLAMLATWPEELIELEKELDCARFEDEVFENAEFSGPVPDSARNNEIIVSDLVLDPCSAATVEDSSVVCSFLNPETPIPFSTHLSDEQYGIERVAVPEILDCNTPEMQPFL